jgi:hypothetical protein
MFPAPCSEFPNDNPLLHEGAILRVDDVCGMPRAEARAPRIEAVIDAEVEVAVVAEVEVAAVAAIEEEPVVSRPSGIYLSGSSAIEEDEGEDIVIAPLEPLDEAEIYGSISLETAAVVESRVEIPPPSVIQIEQAPIVETSVEETPVEAMPAAAEIAACPYMQLVDILCAVAARESTDVASSLRDHLMSGGDATANAWRLILRSESEDFGPCGALSLDEWAADVLARALGAPARSASIRRELRSAGVAAFGLVEAA